MQVSLTEGSEARSLILFSLPLIAGNMLQQLYTVADTLIVGQTMGAAALAAVGSAYALMTLLTSILLGFCMGSGIVFAQLYGSQKIDAMKVAIVNAFVFILCIAAAITALSFILLEKCLVWLHIPAQSVEFTGTYLKIVYIGMLFVYIYNFFASVLRSVGNTVIPLIFLAVSAVINIVLDIVLIVVFKMGIAGAAVATVIAQGVSAAALVVYFFSKTRYLCPDKSHMHYDKKLLSYIIENSTLTAIQQSIMNFGILLVQGLVNSFGFAPSAAFAAVVKIDAFAYMPAQDFGNAFSTFVAQNYGACKRDRIERGMLCAAIISLSFCIVVSLLVCIGAQPLMGLFVNARETEVTAIGVRYLHIVGSCYAGIGLLFLLYGIYRGLGKSSLAIILTIISLGIRVILAYILSAMPSIGLQGVWYAVPVGWLCADMCGLLYFFTQKKTLFNKKLL